MMGWEALYREVVDRAGNLDLPVTDEAKAQCTGDVDARVYDLLCFHSTQTLCCNE